MGIRSRIDRTSGQVLARASVTGAGDPVSIGATATDLVGLSITFTVGRRPVVVVACVPYAITTAATTALIVIADGAGTAKRYAANQVTASNYISLRVEEHITTPGAYTRKVQMFRSGGSGTISFGGLAETESYIKAVTE